MRSKFANCTKIVFINFTFDGVANNGDLTVPVTNNVAFPNSGSSHVLLANPYPSAIDADRFLAENTDVDGVIYLWTAASSNDGGNGTLYTQADYAAYTLAGTVVPSGVVTSFNGTIASGQGFKVRSLTNAGNVTFTNCMRATTGNSSFLKTKAKTAATPKDRFKLNMTGNNGVFSQILIAYLPEATLGYDRMYDAGRNSVSTAQLFSIFEADARRLSINARPPFVDTDIVAIGVSKATDSAPETFTISIAEKEGVFSTSQPVYIYDTLYNTYHDLNNGDFNLTANATELNRYKVTYTAGTLSNPKFENKGVIAMINNNVISLKANLPLTGIEVYDLAGRKILDSKINNTLSSTTPFEFPKAVYIVKAKLNNGTVASFKLMNKN